MKDYFGTGADALRDKRLWLLDMDGTIYEEDRLFDGTQALLRDIRERGGRYVFITNNSSRSVTDYIRKVRGMGIEADADNFFTSVQATVLYLNEHCPGRKVYVQATRSCVAELRAAGIDVTEEACDGIGVILVGFDTELTFEKLRRTCELLTKLPEVPFIACNPDLVCPVSFGFVPDCGSMCIGIEYATGRRPVYIGKPEPTMIDIVRQKFGCSREETVVVGDRLYTDIASGNNARVATICVLSGEATLEDLKTTRDRPTYVFQSVKEVVEGLRE